MQMTKFIRKPYAGKPHVRIEEGVGKVLSFPLYSTGFLTIISVIFIYSTCRHYAAISMKSETGILSYTN